MKRLTKKEKEERRALVLDKVEEAVRDANAFLSPFDLEVSVAYGDEYSKSSRLGSYELGTVFEGEIVVNVFVDNLLKSYRECERDSDRYSTDYSVLAEEAYVTVLHEVGHGLMEKILDYANNVEEIDEWVSSEEAGPFYDVFNDDNLSEEDLVEAFARASWRKEESLLSRCVKAMREKEFL